MLRSWAADKESGFVQEPGLAGGQMVSGTTNAVAAVKSRAAGVVGQFDVVRQAVVLAYQAVSDPDPDPAAAALG